MRHRVSFEARIDRTAISTFRRQDIAFNDDAVVIAYIPLRNPGLIHDRSSRGRRKRNWHYLDSNAFFAEADESLVWKRLLCAAHKQ